MSLTEHLRAALLGAAAFTLAACGGSDDASVDVLPLASVEEQAAEADAEKTLLGAGVSTLIAFRQPEFALADFSRPRQLFENETFDGNGRTCLTCHGRATGTVSPEDARRRFAKDPRDPLFLADGSDDGNGNGATRMQADATVLVRIPLPPQLSLAGDPAARSIVVRRGIPSTLNTPALDAVLMVDGRHASLVAQARDAIADHAQAGRAPTLQELKQIAAFQHTPAFFSSFPLLRFAYTGVEPRLPPGRTASEQRGRRFFIDAPVGGDFKTGLCAACHSGPMLNETNEFIPAPPNGRGGRFQSVAVSEFNAAGNPVYDFVFTHDDGTTTRFSSPDPGRALVTGDVNDLFQGRNAFKIPSLWGVARTAPYFHDNSAKTLEDVVRHYERFFTEAVGLPIDLTDEDQRDIVAYLKLLR